jgi:hypothetical protein
VTGLSLNNGKLYVGGYFDSLGQVTRVYAPRLARLNLTTGAADVWSPRPDGAVEVIQPYYNSQYIAGQFGNIGASVVSGVGNVSNSSNIPNSWNPNPGYDSVYDMAVWQDRLYVAGGFTTISGQNQYPNLVVYKLVVQPDTVRVSSGLPICTGAMTTFTASTAIAGGSYHWTVNGVSVGTSSTTYTYTPAEGDVITCVYTPSAGGCYTDSFAMSSVTVHLTPALTPTVSVTGPNPVCYGAGATYTSVTTVPSTLRIWDVNGVFAGTGASYSYTPANGDVVTSKVVVTPGNCYTADTAISSVTLSVGPPVVPLITLAGPSIQAAGTIVTVNATVSSAGALYQVKWYKNGGYAGTTTTPVYTFTKGTGIDVITATVVPLSNGCYDTASANVVYVYEVSSVAGIGGANGIRVYPNPVGEQLFIEGLRSDDKVTLYDVNGSKKLEISNNGTQNAAPVVVSKLAPGIYFLQVTDKDMVEKCKITISKQ